MIVFGDQYCMLVAGTVPNITVKPGLKFVPNIVTSIPPLVGASLGINRFMMGGVGDGCCCSMLFVNFSSHFILDIIGEENMPEIEDGNVGYDVDVDAGADD